MVPAAEKHILLYPAEVVFLLYYGQGDESGGVREACHFSYVLTQLCLLSQYSAVQQLVIYVTADVCGHNVEILWALITAPFV